MEQKAGRREDLDRPLTQPEMEALHAALCLVERWARQVLAEREQAKAGSGEHRHE